MHRTEWPAWRVVGKRIGRWGERERWLAAGGALTLLPLLLFWREALGLRVFYYHDLQYYFLPYRQLAADTVRRGLLPLWNPYAFGGIPLLGDGQTALFFPLTWLFWVLPPAHALTLGIVLTFSLAGGAMLLYARELGCRLSAAVTAALTFTFSGFLVARVVHPSIMAGAALVPLVFWSVDRLVTRPSARRFAVVAVVVAFQAFTGHPQVPIYTALAVGLYTLVGAWVATRRVGAVARALGLVLGGYATGYALAAIQLLPWVEFATFSPRAAGAGYDFVTDHSLAGPTWLLFLFPYGYGGLLTSWRQSLPASTGVPIYLWERLAYVGLLPLGLALAGAFGVGVVWRAGRDGDLLARRRAARLVALLVVLAAMLLLAAGSGTPAGELVYWLPVVGKLRVYARAAGVADFALAALAGLGVERLARREARWRFRGYDGAALLAAGMLVLGVGGTLALAAAGAFDPAARGGRDSFYWGLLARSSRLGTANAAAQLALAAGSAVVLVALARRVTRPALAVSLALLLLDLGGLAVTFNPTTDPAAFTGTPASVRFLRRDPGPFRVAGLIVDDRLPVTTAREQLALSWTLAFGIEEINGFNSLQPRRYTDLLFGPGVQDVSYGLVHDDAWVTRERALLALLDVKYVLARPGSPVHPDPTWPVAFTSPDVTIYRNPAPVARAWFARAVRVERDPARVLATLRAPGFAPRDLALVESGLSPEQAARLAGGATGEARATQVSPNELRIETDSATDRFLVVSEPWFPGWQATIDGRAVPLYRADYILRGLVVPAGRHSIRMVYRPRSVLLGAGLTLVTGLMLLGAVGVAWWRCPARRRRT